MAEEIIHSRTIKISAPFGLSLRECARLVMEAKRFHCALRLLFEGRRVDCKSILALASLPLRKTAALNVEASGADAQACLEALSRAAAEGLRHEMETLK
jgi:phosphotransferase system HPr (HPr) family protein